LEALLWDPPLLNFSWLKNLVSLFWMTMAASMDVVTSLEALSFEKPSPLSVHLPHLRVIISCVVFVVGWLSLTSIVLSLRCCFVYCNVSHPLLLPLAF
jgi:hypothetical protein